MELVDVPADLERRIRERGQYSGELLAKWHPEKLRQVVKLRADGYSIRAIADLVELSPASVHQAVKREAQSVAEAKAELAGLAKAVTRVALERCAAELESGKVNARDAAVIAGIGADKFLVLEGEANQIVRREADQVTPNAVADWIATLPEAPGQVIEAEPAGGSVGSEETAGQKGEPDPQPSGSQPHDGNV